MTKNSDDKINLNKIEKLLSTSSTSSIYATLTKIQQGEITETDEVDDRLGIDLNGFSKHQTLSEASIQELPKEEKIIETISEPISVPPSVPSSDVQEIDKAATQYKVSIISMESTISRSFDRTLLKVGGRELEFSLNAITTDKHSEKIKTVINGSDAGIIVLPPFTDTSDIHTIINKHVSELWSFNGLGPVPFIITVLEDNVTTGTVPEKELNQSVQTFINHLNPITRGNYGFGIKCHFIKSKETDKELRKILRALSILLISYERFKTQKLLRAEKSK